MPTPPNYKKNLHSLSGIEVDFYNLFDKRYIWPLGINATGRRMLFTGPDGVRNHKVTVKDDPTYVGIGTMSREGTSSLSYLYRPDSKNPPPLYRKHERVGGVGWGVPHLCDPAPPLSGFQIRGGEIRRRAEAMHTHRYQSPWYPPPSQRPKTAPKTMRGTTYSSESLHKSMDIQSSAPSYPTGSWYPPVSAGYTSVSGSGSYPPINRRRRPFTSYSQNLYNKLY